VRNGPSYMVLSVEDTKLSSINYIHIVASEVMTSCSLIGACEDSEEHTVADHL
jgi:hypothetical protein